MGLFSRRTPEPSRSSQPHLPSSPRKAAEFAPNVVETARSLGWAWGSYAAMYRSQPAVRACVDFLARNIAQLNPKVFERVGDTDRIEVGNHGLARLLRHPNPSDTRYAHLYSTVADLAVYDRAFWRKIRQGPRLAVVRVAPAKVSFEVDDGQTVYRDERGQVIPRDQLVIFSGYSPDGDTLGVSPLETLRRILVEEVAAQQHREFFWRNAARQSGTIERPIDAPQWSKEARDRFRADWESTQTGGANSGRTGILEEGMTWNPSGFSPKDSMYIEGRMLTRKEVAITYGIAPSLVGAGEDTNANLEANHRHLYQDTLGPWLRMLQDEIELQLLPDFEVFNARRTVYVEFNLAEKLKGSFEEQQRALTTAVGVPHMTVNEGRARVNLPRIDEDWADVPVQPLNVLYGGQPAVTVPTDVPGTASVEPQMKALAQAEESARDEAAEEHRELLVAFFDRQERSVVASLTQKALTDADMDRWNRELSADLYTQSVQTTSSHGRATAVALGGVYSEARTRDWLLANADRTAQSVNNETFAALRAAGGDLDEVRDVFGQAKGHRADRLGLSLATTLVAFGRMEAGRHTADATDREVVKTWRVTTADSRHPEMNGETVPVDSTFSNGARWPGDPALGAEGAAGCQCILDIGER